MLIIIEMHLLVVRHKKFLNFLKFYVLYLVFKFHILTNFNKWENVMHVLEKYIIVHSVLEVTYFYKMNMCKQIHFSNEKNKQEKPTVNF